VNFMEFSGFEIDFSFLQQLGQVPLYEAFWILFSKGGWIVFLIILLWGLGKLWMFWRSNIFAAKQSYVLLAIDIPKQNLQSPKAVENIFAALAGAHGDPNIKEKYIDGYFQVGFSCEIVSIDGYVQFLIRTPVKFRELTEAAIYAQYPEAEVTEVNDYASAVDITFPNEEYGLWGSDLELVRPYYYPIRTYVEFEHSLSQEFKDPMAAMLEIMNKIGKGEQIWFQIVIIPVLGHDWKEEGVKALNKILGIPEKVKKSKTQKIFEAPLEFATMAKEQLVGGGQGQADDAKSESNMLAYLPPHQKAEVDGIGRKISKIGFRTKMRFIYLSKKEVMKKGLGVSGMFGAIKQFNTEDLNAMKPQGKTKTVAAYIGAKRRLARKQNQIMKYYKGRSLDSYGDPFYLNIEELASLYHFPAIEVKAPLVQKIESKKGSAPIGLPTEVAEEKPVLGAPIAEETEAEKEPEPVVDFDTDDFEKRFAKDKTGQTTKSRKEYIKEKYDLPDEMPEEPQAEDEESTAKDVPDNLPFV